jgi:hypothetical protein
MIRLFRISVLVLILALLIPVLFDRMSIMNEYGMYGEDGKYGVTDLVKPRSTYRTGLVKGETAISHLQGDHLISASKPIEDGERAFDRLRALERKRASERLPALDRERALEFERATERDPTLDSGRTLDDVRLVAASDYQGEVVVVAGERSQLYVFRKNKDRYLLKQVLWDGATNFPLSLAITENGRYAVIMTGKTMVDVKRTVFSDFPVFRKRTETDLVIWDIEKEEKIQEIGRDTMVRVVQYGMGKWPLATAGRSLVLNGISIINADLSGKKELSDIYVKIPPPVFGSSRKQIACAPLAGQVLVKNDKENNLALYKVRDEARDKWWKWWSNDVTLEKISDAFQACSPEDSKCSMDALFPAFEVAPDGRFFVILRNDGMLEAYSLPGGTFMSSIQTDMEAAREPHLTIMDGVVYLANGTNSSGEDEDEDGDGAFWSWKPGDAQLRSQELECADYTRLLNNGYIATLGCRDKGMDLRFVALANPFRIQAFAQPLRLQ